MSRRGHGPADTPAPGRWSLNGRFLAQPLTGVQRYAMEIARELDGFIAAGHPLARGLTLDILVPPGTAVPAAFAAMAIRPVGGATGGHLWEQAVLPRHLRGGLLSLCNTGPVRVQRQIVCIHDVNTRVCPASYSRGFRAAYRILHPLLGRRAARIATVSDHSASQLVGFGIAPRGKIFVAPNGCEHAVRWRPEHSDRTRPFADGRTVVAVGSPAPHKNIALLLRLAPELERAGLRLALVGERDARVFRSPAGAPGTAAVVWLGRLSDGEIAALLRDALCLAFPSLAEGFGIPALEAMASHCPVVAADRSSLPEVCGEAALYAAPDDPAAWLRHVFRLAGDGALRDELAAKGEVRARQFSWRVSAERYLEAMAAIDGRLAR